MPNSIQSIQWLAVILDEAQNIKNPEAKQTQVIRKLEAEFRIALTGTPVENRLSELWSIMHFLNPGYLGTRKAFRENFALPIERYHDEEALEQLKQLTTPVHFAAGQDRPARDLGFARKSGDEGLLHADRRAGDAVRGGGAGCDEKIEEEEGIQRRGLVLSMLMQLKQICNHPVQYLHQAGKGTMFH